MKLALAVHFYHCHFQHGNETVVEITEYYPNLEVKKNKEFVLRA